MRILGYAALTTACVALCRFPLLVALAFIAAATIAASAHRSPTANRVLWCAVWAAFCAQLGVLPVFAWPLRFAFFAVLIGYFMGYVALRQRDQL